MARTKIWRMMGAGRRTILTTLTRWPRATGTRPLSLEKHLFWLATGLGVRVLIGLAGASLALHESIDPALKFFGAGPLLTRFIALVIALIALFEAIEKIFQIIRLLAEFLETRSRRRAAHIVIGATASFGLHFAVIWMTL